MITSNVSQIKNYGDPITRGLLKWLQHRQHANALTEDEKIGVTHYLYNVPTYYDKQGLRSPCKDYSSEQMRNDDILKLRTKYYEVKYRSLKSY